MPCGGQKFDFKEPRWRTADAKTSSSIEDANSITSNIAPCPRSMCSKRLSKGQNRDSADADGGAYWRNLANAIEPSMFGDDADLCKITCCYYYDY